MSQIIYALPFLLWSSFAYSFENYFPIGDSQVKESKEQIENAEELNFDAVLAFERLMCADRSFVRSFASEVGLSSGNTTIRSRALLSALMEKETITLEPYFEKGIEVAEKTFAKENSMLSFGVVYKNADQACLSLFSDRECIPDYTLSVEGDEVTLRYKDKSARLSLDSEGKLKGIYADKSAGVTRVPVELKLR